MLWLWLACAPEPGEPPSKTAESGCALRTFYWDGDGDGAGDPLVSVEACALPSGHVEAAGDCDPASAAAYPGAAEVCDGIDNDCDGDADGGAVDQTTRYADADGDGFGDPARASTGCAHAEGEVEAGTDCDDGEAAIHPAAIEVCDGIDDDCDGQIDDADPDLDLATASAWYADGDGDGYGDPAAGVAACEAPVGYVADASDCDDLDPFLSPGVLEVCDGRDNDCDGTIDEPDAVDAPSWYADGDGDGYGDITSAALSCVAPPGAAARPGDCDDGDAAISPAAAEVCDVLGVDEDCDGTSDDGDLSVDLAGASTWYGDADGDGFGDATAARLGCDAAAGEVADGSDCDDGDVAIHPAAVEVCDALDVDEDCDGLSDDGDPDLALATASAWYADSDGDGYGDATDSAMACTQPTGYVSGSSDCDDGDAGVNPAAAEVCNGHDDDCAGAADPSAPSGCPSPGSLALTEGDGLYGVSASGYVLQDEDGWADAYALIDALDDTLPTVGIAALMADLNRDGDPMSSADLPRATGFSRGFVWNSGDVEVDYWFPQGITGSFDADPSGLVDGEQIVVVSWHYDPAAGGTSYDKGVRLSFVDVSSTADNDYRHVLLVKPTGTTASPSFEAVNVHAGGIAWVGDYLYVADTSYGLRVFDTRHILQVSTDTDTLGCDSAGACRAYTYKYVLPQVTRYSVPGCGCGLTFSFVGLDQSSSPPSLITGEYDSAAITGLLVRWPLDPATGLLDPWTAASEAYVAQQDRMQGAASRNGEWWLSCSSQSGAYGRLYNATTSTSTGYTWVDGPEDLAIDPNNRRMWSLTEDVGDRWVFAVNLSSVGG